MSRITFALLLLVSTSTCADAKGLVGVINRQGQSIVPMQFTRIEPVGKCLYFCESTKVAAGFSLANLPKAQAKTVDPRASFRVEVVESNADLCLTSLLNRDGKPVDVKLPANLLMTDVTLPRFANNLYYNNLPEDALVTVFGKEGFGIVDGRGTVVLQPKYRRLKVHDDESIKLLPMDKLIQSTSIPQKVEIPKSGIIPAPDPDNPHPGQNNSEKFDLDLNFQRSLQLNSREGKSAQGLHEGLIRFSDKGKFGFKDSTGKIKIPATFFAAREFANGLAPVRLNSFSQNGRYVYIDKLGKTVTPEFFRAEPFVGKTAIVSTNEARSRLFGLIDAKGKYILDPYIHHLLRLKDGRFVADNMGETTVYDSNGKFVSTIGRKKRLIGETSEGFLVQGTGDNEGLFETFSTDAKLVTAKRINLPPANEYLHVEFKRLAQGQFAQMVVDKKGKVILGPSEDNYQVIDQDRIIKSQGSI